MENTPTASRAANPYVLPASILIAALIVAGSIIYLVQSGGVGGGNGGDRTPALENPFVPEAAAATEEDVVLGDPAAPVFIAEYGDYQCPFCGIYFGSVEQQIKEQYVGTGKAAFTFRNFAFLGPESTASAAAAECAKDQGKFWEYHDALYVEEVADFERCQADQSCQSSEHNGNLNRALFLRLAGQLGLDTAEFTTCVDSEKHVATVQRQSAEAADLGVQSTPSTFVNGKQVVVEDANGNPVPHPQYGTLQGVGASGAEIFEKIEAALQASGG